MSDIVISVEGLSKSYWIGHEAAERERYTALRDVIGRETRNFLRKTRGLFRGEQILAGDEVEEFWALRDVSFEVRRGEVLGVIGRNGAGKSTLLKILSRITEPTTGRVTLRGRVASLLEVGTGFHPELTGRENIYLNGAILGMKRTEIRRRFDEIVAFAEVEEFLDTPVKRYSSGMYVRLAFAVAAHLEPEILVVDEVLSVGDVEFQKKCIGKMDESAKSGRTVLFVSHDMRRASALCNRGILLKAGCVVSSGPMAEVIETYLAEHIDSAASIDLSGRSDRTGSGDAHFMSVELSTGGEPTRAFAMGETFAAMLRVRAERRLAGALIGLTIMATDGTRIYQLMNTDDHCRWDAEPGDYTFSVAVERLMLYPGNYVVELWIGDRNSARVDFLTSAISFVVTHDHRVGIDRYLSRISALVLERSRWNCRKDNTTTASSSTVATER